ncbi:MAG: EF-hand domain-containing protein [Actinomycetota bacterium]|nr:EF-hand domain-containing protein [Actinomycetota bacterium]
MRKSMAIAGLTMTLVLVGCGDDSEDPVGAGPTTTVDTAQFSTLDRNGDSYLDVDEVAEWKDRDSVFAKWDADADSELDRDEIAGNAFSLWDADRNGKISQQEWKQGAELWYPRGVDYGVYGDWDRDGDSELDADEIKEKFDFSVLGESWRARPISRETFKKAYFELYDSDDDGKVSTSEWTQGSRVFGIPK